MIAVQTPDSILIEKFQNGDSEAMNSLIQRHQVRAYTYAYRLTRDSDAASDLVAEAFVRVFRSARNFRGQSAFTTWLYRIISNCFLDARKKAASKPAVSIQAMMSGDDGTLEREFEFKGASAHEESERAERSRTIAGAVAGLSRGHRTMIEMFHAQMLTYEEIADVLNMPLGTVKSRLNRARLALRLLLEPERALFVSEPAALAA
jgi:RNA polymerase sigma-70 factor (ECF subfamily)